MAHMGKLRPGHLVEAAIWLGFAALALYFTFAFDRPLEIYKFGAAAWPRAIIVMIVLAALGQLFSRWRAGEEDDGDIEQSAAPSAPSPADPAALRDYYLRVVPIVGLPFLYAYLLEPVGFYSLTPPFIAAIIWLMGERRWKSILAITALIYSVLVFLFATVLYVGLPTGNLHPFYDISNWLLIYIR